MSDSTSPTRPSIDDDPSAGAEGDGIIRQMSDTLANKIAAGEVVQRPASVAKELIENAVDAGASSIQLVVKDAGSTLVQVIDDGCGMSRSDARRCFQRHATSKIREIDDLDRIRTLGFRGEALASIASIARVELQTQRVEDDIGTEVRVDGGDLVHVRPCALPGGTTISVRNLFYNVPARRNFLKTPATELKHLTDVFRSLALAHPGIAFQMQHQDRVLYDLSAAQGESSDASAPHFPQHSSPLRDTLQPLFQRITDLLEIDQDGMLVPVQDRLDELSVRGFVVDPRARRQRRKADQFLFVNGRYVQDRYLSHAVRKAYDELLPDKAFPFFALFLDMDPRRVDVNVHPAKAEVKFEDESGMYGFLVSAVKKALSEISRAPQFDRADPASDRPHKTTDDEGRPPRFSDGQTGPSETDREPPSATGTGETPPHHESPASDRPAGAPRPFQPRSRNRDRTASTDEDPAHPHRSTGHRSTGHRSAREETSDSPGSGDVPPGDAPSRERRGANPGTFPPSGSSRSSPFTTDDAGTLTHELYRGPKGGETSNGVGPVWSLHGRYLITPTRNGMLVVDQRAAHVRVLYEEALQRIEDGHGESQQLLFPVTVDLRPAEEALLDEWLPELEAAGFDVERMSGRTVTVRGVPTHVREESESTIFRTVLSQLKEGASPASDDRTQRMARTLAQQSAVPREHTLTPHERRTLIQRLMDCEMPYADPSGTPTTLDLSLEEIEQRFRS